MKKLLKGKTVVDRLYQKTTHYSKIQIQCTHCESYKNVIGGTRYRCDFIPWKFESWGDKHPRIAADKACGIDAMRNCPLLGNIREEATHEL